MPRKNIIMHRKSSIMHHKQKIPRTSSSYLEVDPSDVPCARAALQKKATPYGKRGVAAG